MERMLTLSKPVMIDGEPVKGFTYDAQEITGDQFIEAETLAGEMHRGQKNITTPVMEVDYAFHTYLGYMAIIAVNPQVSVSDLKRVKGIDNIHITEIGRDFILETSEEISTDGVSDGSTEPTQGSGTPGQESSEDDGSGTS